MRGRRSRFWFFEMLAKVVLVIVKSLFLALQPTWKFWKRSVVQRIHMGSEIQEQDPDLALMGVELCAML